jgi:hypothetical protein
MKAIVISEKRFKELFDKLVLELEVMGNRETVLTPELAERAAQLHRKAVYLLHRFKDALEEPSP